jgi:regulator of cell morphogenesis and NO signaling
MTIRESSLVADIAAAVPSSIAVFQRHGVDFCCGGKRPIGEVCEEQGLSFAELASAIEASAERPAAERDWTSAPLSELIAHIVQTYHSRLREELPRLEGMAAKVEAVHGEKTPHLARLRRIVEELSADLLAHMQKEEQVLFPAIANAEARNLQLPPSISMPIAVMEREHDSAGGLLAELQRITDSYVPPAWACQTFRTLYQGLQNLEAEMHVHVHLENNVLFPRALERAGR